MAGVIQLAAARPTNPGVICQPTRIPSLPDLVRRRVAHGISVGRWLAVANVHPDTLRQARRGTKPRRATLLRLSVALDDLTGERPAARPPAAIVATVHLTTWMLKTRIEEDFDLSALVGRRARTLAIYLVAVELEIENAEIARALKCGRQNIQQLRLDVEELRDHAKVDALLDEGAALMKGEVA